ncbi:FimB/Mfa2 family fimbrial subunit [Alistipes sp. i18-0019-D1]|uniref:FimB/Mfa2 family fimbrial subunit n=1 Tax=Alistipes sp. i18-0019-D1 TaxID=3132707 RepID=UPI0036F43B74
MRRLLYSLLLAAALLGTGCTKEDLSDCPTEVRLDLNFTYNKDGVDRFASEVSSAEFFLYGQNGELLWSRTLTADEIAAQSLSLSVGPGAASYTAVLWANYTQVHYDLTGQERTEAMNLALKHADGVVSQRPGHLLHGTLNFETDAERTPVHRLMSLRKLTNTVHVILEGAMSGTRNASGTPYSVQLSGSNGAYNYDGSKAASRSLTYLPEYTHYVEGHQQALGADFTTMHLCTGDDMRVTVFNGSQTLYDELLVPLLMQSDEINTDEDLWRYDEYTLLFNANMVLTAIKVLDWTIIDTSDGGI